MVNYNQTIKDENQTIIHIRSTKSKKTKMIIENNKPFIIIICNKNQPEKFFAILY